MNNKELKHTSLYHTTYDAKKANKIRSEIYKNFGEVFVKWQQENPCPKCKEQRLDIYTKGKGIICTGCNTMFEFKESVISKESEGQVQNDKNSLS